jgi:hypothetical protein
VTDLAGKRVELLREVIPGLHQLAIMVDVGYPAAVLEMGEVQAAARILKLLGRENFFQCVVSKNWIRCGSLS